MLHVLKNILVYDEHEAMHWNAESVENKYTRLQQWNTFRTIELKLICTLEENVISSAVESNDYTLEDPSV